MSVVISGGDYYILRKANDCFRRSEYGTAIKYYEKAKDLYSMPDSILDFNIALAKSKSKDSSNYKLKPSNNNRKSSLRGKYNDGNKNKRKSYFKSAQLEKFYVEVFDEKWYLENNKDIRKSSLSSFEHFMQWGFKEGRLPCSPDDISNMVEEIITKNALTEYPCCNEYVSYRADPTRLKDFNICICYNSKGNFFFSEIAAVLKESLTCFTDVVLCDEVEVLNSDFDYYILVAPHEAYALDREGGLYDFLKSKMPSVGYYLTEQPQTPFFQLQLKYLYDDIDLMEMNLASARFLRAIGLSAYYAPLEVSSGTGFNKLREFSDSVNDIYIPKNVREFRFNESRFLDRPIDISYVGNCCTRRSVFFAKNASYLSRFDNFIFIPEWSLPHSVNSVASLNTNDSLAVAQRSKIFLNIHRDKFNYFEWHRIVLRGIVSGSVVVTEPVQPVPGIVPGFHYIEASIDDMPHMLSWLLETVEGNRKLEEIHGNAMDLISAMASDNSFPYLIGFLTGLNNSEP